MACNPLTHKSLTFDQYHKSQVNAQLDMPYPDVPKVE